MSPYTSLLITWLLFTGCEQRSTPSNDDISPRDRLDECKPWGKVDIFVKNKDDSFTLLNKIPHDLICELSECEMVDGTLRPVDPLERNFSLGTTGLYGLGSITTPEFARLIVFKTKSNHSDPDEEHVDHGCTGTLPDQHIPPPGEKWLAYMRRGDCLFTDKLENAVNSHGADGFVVFNNDDKRDKVIMELEVPKLVTIMINNSVGERILIFQQILDIWITTLPNSSLPYTNQIYTNISFSFCEQDESKEKAPLAVTIVTITFIVVMILALSWLVVYYFQKHRNANKQAMHEIKLQTAAKKALKKIGTRVIADKDDEANEDNEQDCTYCLETLIVGETIRELPCHHKFHKDCVDDWLIHNRSCPNCHSDILRATGITLRGIKHTEPEEESPGTELTEMAPDSRQQLLSDSQPIAGHSEAGSQYLGSQVIPGSQLLTDGQNFFLHVPNDVDLPPDTTIQIENPPANLAISHQQMMAAAAAAEGQHLLSPDAVTE